MKVKEILLTSVFCFALAVPAWADAKSRTVQVSCTITPQFEVGRNHAVKPLPAHETQYQMSEQLCMRGDQKIKFYSLTAR